MRKARLIVTNKCPKNCVGCCNKDWKGEPAKKMENFDFDKILITGGEPMLFPQKLIDLCIDIRSNSKAKLILYTAKTNQLMMLMIIMHYVDGLTVTIHEDSDIQSFINFNNSLRVYLREHNMTKKLRLNVFSGDFSSTALENEDLSIWNVDMNRQWIKDAPLPENEELFELPELW